MRDAKIFQVTILLVVLINDKTFNVHIYFPADL